MPNLALNHGGERAANNALYVIVLSRMRFDPRTRHYVERRTKEGLSKMDESRRLHRAEGMPMRDGWLELRLAHLVLHMEQIRWDRLCGLPRLRDVLRDVDARSRGLGVELR